MLLVIALLACVATTNIPNLKAQVEKACHQSVTLSDGRTVNSEQYYKAVDLRIEEAGITWTVTYAKDMTGISPTEIGMNGGGIAYVAAQSRNIIVRALNPALITLVYKDGKDIEFCRFIFEKGKDEPVFNRCVQVVE